MEGRKPRVFIVEASQLSINGIFGELSKCNGTVVGIASFCSTAVLNMESILRDPEPLDIIIIAEKIGQMLSNDSVKYVEDTFYLIGKLREKFKGIIVGGARDANQLRFMRRAGCDDVTLHQDCGGFTGAETINRALELWKTNPVHC